MPPSLAMKPRLRATSALPVSGSILVAFLQRNEGSSSRVGSPWKVLPVLWLLSFSGLSFVLALVGRPPLELQGEGECRRVFTPRPVRES